MPDYGRDVFRKTSYSAGRTRGDARLAGVTKRFCNASLPTTMQRGPGRMMDRMAVDVTAIDVVFIRGVTC